MKRILFSTLAEFKRQATKGRYVRGGYFNTARGERVRNDWREIIGVQSNAIKLKTDGVAGGVYFDFPKASECKIEDGILKIFEERVEIPESGEDVRANTSWLKYRIECGDIKESELKRYARQVAQYELAE